MPHPVVLTSTEPVLVTESFGGNKNSGRSFLFTNEFLEELDMKFSDIEPPYRISNAELLAEFNKSNSPGNFAKHLLEKLFPELFTDEYLCRFYSYYGGGRQLKFALNSYGLGCLYRYVIHFYPEVSNPIAWKKFVVKNINSALRRSENSKSEDVIDKLV